MAKFELIIIDEQYYPAAITNHSLSMGEKLGLIEGSNLTDILETESYLAIIYLSIIGVNKNLGLSFDEFMGKYQISPQKLISTYNNLLKSSTDIKSNKFAKGFTTSTNKKLGKDQKQIKSPKLHFECVEDRYVMYCLVGGIESDIFWHYPIPDVERIYENISAYRGWKNNPK